MEWIAGGYVLRKNASEPPYRDFMNRTILSISHCVSDCLPDALAFHSKSTYDVKERRNELAKFGLNPTILPQLEESVESLFARRELEWPHVFFSPDIARTFVSSLGIRTKGLSLLGIGLGGSYLQQFREKEKSEGTVAPNGFYLMIEKGEQMAAHGSHVGFDVLGGEHWPWPHYWKCYDTGVERELGISPNLAGLIEKFDDAEKVASFLNRLDPPAGMGDWYPWAVFDYALT